MTKASVSGALPRWPRHTGHRILLDTAAHPDTVLRNLAALKIDIADVNEVIVSHHHLDHPAGLVTLLETLAKRNPKALSTAHVATGIFANRSNKDGAEANPMIAIRTAYERVGSSYSMPGLLDSSLASGSPAPVPRNYPERNWIGTRRIRLAGGGIAEDNLPEDQTLVIDTAQGPVAVAGCSHAGIVNVLDYACAKVQIASIHAAIGGFHLFAAKEETLACTASKCKEFILQNLLGAHCSGIEAVYRLRELAHTVPQDGRSRRARHWLHYRLWFRPW